MEVQEFWRLEIRDQGGCIVGFLVGEGPLPGFQIVTFLLYTHVTESECFGLFSLL